MIAFVEGILVEKQPTRVVIAVQGIGYELFIPLSSYDALPPTNQPCRLLTHQHVREDDLRLFGFATEEERRMFLLLLGVNGVGPKLAISALSGMTVRELKAAVVAGDVKRLSTVSGIGRKTAERMIVELKDRLDAGDALEAAAGGGAAAETPHARDAMLALAALGYTREQAARMIAEALRRFEGGRAPGVEELIRRALGR
jgi:Holliday junction DNA helicase RuvA